MCRHPPTSASFYTTVATCARSDVAGGGNESADCGALIRKAWVMGVVQ